MTKRILAVLAATTALSASTAQAADISAAGADSLKSTFERYVGKAAEGRPPRVTVVPEASDYLVTLNIQSMVDEFVALLPKSPETENIVFQVTPYSVAVAPLDDRTWKVTKSDGLKVSYSFLKQSGSFKMDGLSFEGIYDPNLWSYRSATSKIANYSADSDAPNGSASVVGQDLQTTIASTAGANGHPNVDIAMTGGAFTETIHTKPNQDPAVPMPAMAIAAKLADRQSHYVIVGSRSAEFMDLWTFLVANPSKDALVAKQADLKSKITAVLPLFDTVSTKSTLGTMTVQTPFGQGELNSIGADIGVVNTPGANSVAVAFKAAGLKIDSVFVPNDYKPLLPTDFDFSFSLKGYDLNDGATKLVDMLDLTQAAPPTPEQTADLIKAWLPDGTLTYDLQPSKISSAAYSIGWFGIVEVRPQHVKLHLDVTATGIDAVIKAVQQIKDPKAAGASVGLYAAKALAKPGENGALTWAIDFEQGGPLLVNGQAIGPKKSL